MENCVHGPASINATDSHHATRDVQDDLDKALKLVPCDWCTSKGQSHCNHAKPAPVAQYLAEALRASSASGSSRELFAPLGVITLLTVSLVLQNRIRNLSVAWNQYQASYLQSRVALASYQSQLGEFAVDLLLARDYHQFDPQYWVNCGLATSQSEVDKVFAAAEGCLYDDSTGLDPADAAVALFNAQARMNEFVHRSLGDSEFVWPLLPSASTWIDCRNEARRQADLPPLSSDVIRDVSPPKSAPVSANSSQPVAGPSSVSATAGPSRVTRRSAAAAAEIAASVSAAPRSRSSSSSFELQASRSRPKRGGKPVNLAAAKRD